MTRDPIVEEIHLIRDEIAKKYNFDYEAMLRDVVRRQQESGHPVVSFKPRRIAANAAPARPKGRRNTARQNRS